MADILTEIGKYASGLIAAGLLALANKNRKKAAEETGKDFETGFNAGMIVHRRINVELHDLRTFFKAERVVLLECAPEGNDMFGTVTNESSLSDTPAAAVWDHKKLSPWYVGLVSSLSLESPKVLQADTVEDASLRAIYENTGIVTSTVVLIGVVRKGVKRCISINLPYRLTELTHEQHIRILTTVKTVQRLLTPEG